MIPEHPVPSSRPSSAVPRLEVEPPTPAYNPNMPFRDYPDGQRHSLDPEEEDFRDDREILDSQEMVMQGESVLSGLAVVSHSPVAG